MLLIALTLVVGTFVGLDSLCREKPAGGLNWFLVYPHLTPSKKLRGRSASTRRRGSRSR